MEIYITDRRRAGKALLSTNTGSQITHIVSFGAPERDQRPPAGFHYHPAQKIRFCFHDIERDGDFQGLIPPGKEHIEKLIEFYRGSVFDHNNPVVLIHCYAGVSRSTAAGLILLYMSMGDATEAFDKLMEIRPVADPNMKMIRFADEVLEKNGEFFQEVSLARMAWVPKEER